MTRGLPRITPDWTASGWTTASSHVRGSYRMLGLWAVGLVGAVVVSHHGHRYLAALLGAAAILVGTVVYTRLDTQFAPPTHTAGPARPAELDAAPARQLPADPARPPLAEPDRRPPVPVSVEVLEIGPAR